MYRCNRNKLCQLVFINSGNCYTGRRVLIKKHFTDILLQFLGLFWNINNKKENIPYSDQWEEDFTCSEHLSSGYSQLLYLTFYHYDLFSFNYRGILRNCRSGVWGLSLSWKDLSDFKGAQDTWRSLQKEMQKKPKKPGCRALASKCWCHFYLSWRCCRMFHQLSALLEQQNFGRARTDRHTKHSENEL